MTQVVRKRIISLLFAASCVSQACAGVVIMDFNSLPSTQGWTYEATGNSASETSVFSVSGGVLRQNSMGLGFAAQGDNVYLRPIEINDHDPFQLIVRARVLQSEGAVATNPFGFAFGVNIGGDSYLVGLSPTQVQGLNQAFVGNIDNTEFHTYEMVGTPGVGFTLFVDSVFVGSATALHLGPPYGLQIGDNTGGTNALAEVSRYEFRQEPSAIPEPTSFALVGTGIILTAVGSAKRRRRSMVQPQGNI